MTVGTHWQRGGGPDCTALTFNYEFLEDATTNLRVDSLKLHCQPMSVRSIATFSLIPSIAIFDSTYKHTFINWKLLTMSYCFPLFSL